MLAHPFEAIGAVFAALYRKVDRTVYPALNWLGVVPHWRYFKYVARHKYWVMRGCFYYGLFWRGIKHDWTKFLPSEWFPYVEFFYGEKVSDKGVQSARRGYYHQSGIPENITFDMAWNHHQKRNDHHWQYWLLNRDNGEVLPLPMPDICRKEMLADWYGAGMAQGKPNTWEWFDANEHKMQLHPETHALVKSELERWRDMHRVGVMMGFEKR
jgi:hypothetical protein